jgi:ubiquitin-protein ligase
MKHENINFVKKKVIICISIVKLEWETVLMFNNLLINELLDNPMENLCGK